VTASAKPDVAPTVEIEAGLSLRAIGDQAFIEARYGREVAAGAKRFRGMPLVAAAVACLRIEGRDADGGTDEVVKAALSTTTFTTLLANVANVSLLKSYNDVPSTALKWCSEGDNSDFKTATRARLNLSGGLEEVGPDGLPKHLSADDEAATVQVKTQALAFAITRQDMINDNLGAVTRVPTRFGALARMRIDDLAYTRLLANKLSDGSTALFSTAFGNYIEGATTVLSAEGLRQGKAAFLKMTDAKGYPIGVVPKYLVVAPELDFLARQLVTSATLQHVGASTSADKNNPTSNPHFGAFEVVVDPRLSNSKFTGYSTTAWYLIADQSVADTIEVTYLSGQRTPTINQVGNGSILRVEYECVFDVSANVLDARGMLKSKGAG
jgi:hypothetical protein